MDANVIIKSKNPTIRLNGVEFTQYASIPYKFGYANYIHKIESGDLDGPSTYRKLILEDLFFIVYFILGMSHSSSRDQSYNTPFHVQACKDVEGPPETDTLDVWFRGSGKSSIITIAETVQYHLKHPEESTCIFSYAKHLAESFVRSIRDVLETDIIKDSFPEVVWENGETQSPSWSLQNGITLRRKGVRPEPTVMASGLLEGMVTGKHFNRRVYDDIETEDIQDSPEQLAECYRKWEMSWNLGMPTGKSIERNIGTHYNHLGPINVIRNKQDADGNLMYFTRIKPRTHDGTISGRPVIGTEKELGKLKTSMHFNSQQLCDPTPSHDMTLDPSFIIEIEHKLIPKDLFKVLIVDPAGDAPTTSKNSKDTDSWAIMLFGIQAPESEDDFNICTQYLLDAYIDKLQESEAVDIINRMYLTSGRVMVLAYEKFSNFTPAVASQVVEVLRKRGRNVTEKNHSFYWTRPASREKKVKIKNALQWPLNNGRLYMSKNVEAAYRERIKVEMEKFPAYHDDAIDAWSYVADILKESWAMSMIGSLSMDERRISVLDDMDKYGMAANGEEAWT